MRRRLTRRTFLAAVSGAPLVAAQSRTRTASTSASGPSDELLALAGSCVMAGWYGRGIDFAVRSLVRRGAIGGLFVRRNNFRDRASLVALCQEARGLATDGTAPLIAADQEGGPVEHLSPPLTSFPSMTTLGAIDDVELTRRAGAAVGHELRAVGISIDFAPVLDVRTSPHNVVDLNRAFGREPALVARHGRAWIEGLSSAGVLPCPKHFPGHGDASVDSHAGLPRVPHGLARLDQVELVPFRECLSLSPAIMIAHVVYAGLDARNPASLSSSVIDGVLRRHLSFDGVAISDDLQMAAVRGRGGIEQAALQSMRAGCDVLLVAHSQNVALNVIRHLARTAMTDTALRERLTVASGRVRRLRERAAQQTVAPNPSPPDGPAVAREIQRRFAALPPSRTRRR